VGIDLDGQLIAQSASGARVKVETGEHLLTVTAPGRHHYAGRLTVTAGAVVDVPVHLHHDSVAVAPAKKPVAAAAGAPAKPADKPRDKRADPDYLVDPFSGSK
jgi:hypothetical protein